MCNNYFLPSLLSNESHLPFSSDTKKFPLSAVILTIMIMATLLNVQWMVPSSRPSASTDSQEDKKRAQLEEMKTQWTQYIVSAVLYIIPAIVMAAFNAAIFRQLKRLFHSDQFSSARNEIERVLFQIGLTNLIAIIFVGCQVAYAIWVGLLIVSWFVFSFSI